MAGSNSVPVQQGPALRGRRVLGLFQGKGRSGVVRPFRPGDGGPVKIPGSFRMGASTGSAVEVLILRAPRGPEPADGKVVEVLGRLGSPEVDTRVVARIHRLRDGFPPDTLVEAKALPGTIPPAERKRRERFDDPAPVTIDGETARDFDDAIAVERRRGGGFRLYVHIADVAHFVSPGSALDREALRRGTSVYFPGRVLPMFPERLSNNLCSLRPEEDRLVQTVVVDLDARGHPTATRFADGIIRSAARLTYEQVAQLLEGKKRPSGLSQQLVPMLRAADELRSVLEKRRAARGSVDFDLPEPRILLDVEGAMTGVAVEPRNVAHRLIEECMLLANEVVATFLEGRGAPGLFRVHEPPDPLKMEGLQAFLQGLGIRFRGPLEGVGPRRIRRLLTEAEGRPEYPVIVQAVLRAMKQARYSPENSGHFGLASPSYAHFTSPIRRYPDLWNHRVLRRVRAGRRGLPARLEGGLERLAEDSSRLERAAEAAERMLLEWKKVDFLRGREGETVEGVVTAVTPFGLFVQIPEAMVEGLVHVGRLGRERFEFDPRRLVLRGTRTGVAFRVGAKLRVAIARVDRALHRVVLEPEPKTAGSRGGGPARTRDGRGHRKAPAGTRAVRRGRKGRRR